MSPEVLNPDTLAILDYVGIAVFAVAGALVAAEKEQTLVTFAFFAVAVGVGGGTLRDLLIGAPVFWVNHNTTMVVCLVAALGVWFFGRYIRSGAMLWFDAIGLVAYAVYGTEKALRYGVAPVPASLMGVMTACAGGIIRDVLAGQPSIILRPDIYVTAAALSASLYASLVHFEISTVVAAVVAGILGFALRAGAIQYGLGIPSFRGREARIGAASSDSDHTGQ